MFIGFKPQENVKPAVIETLREFTENDDPGNSSIVFAGTGINSGLYNMVFESLGKERLDKVKGIHIVSGSIYPYLFFLARQEGKFLWTRAKLKNWEPAARKWMGIIPLLSFAKVLWCLATKKEYFFSSDQAVLPVKKAVSPDFYNQKISSLPHNVSVWVYNNTKHSLEEVTATSEKWKDRPLIDLARATPAFPPMVQAFKTDDETFSDPDFSRANLELRNKLKTSGANVLFCNMYRHGRQGDVFYLKPHQYKSGKAMMIIDYLIFLLGIPNKRVADSVLQGHRDAKPAVLRAVHQ